MEEDYRQHKISKINKTKLVLKIVFAVHLIVYVAVNGFLAFVNLYSSPSYLWFLWVLFGWGIGIVIHGGISTLVLNLLNNSLNKYIY